MPGTPLEDGLLQNAGVGGALVHLLEFGPDAGKFGALGVNLGAELTNLFVLLRTVGVSVEVARAQVRALLFQIVDLRLKSLHVAVEFGGVLLTAGTLFGRDESATTGSGLRGADGGSFGGLRIGLSGIGARELRGRRRGFLGGSGALLEIVERIHARGQVHRRLVGLVLEGAAPEAGTKLLGGADAKEVGEVASGAEIEINGTKHNLALAYVRQEFLTGLKNLSLIHI